MRRRLSGYDVSGCFRIDLSAKCRMSRAPTASAMPSSTASKHHRRNHDQDLGVIR